MQQQPGVSLPFNLRSAAPPQAQSAQHRLPQVGTPGPAVARVSVKPARSAPMARSEAYRVGAQVEVLHKGDWHAGSVIQNDGAQVTVQFQPVGLGPLAVSYPLGHQNIRVPVGTLPAHHHQPVKAGDKVQVLVDNAWARGEVQQVAGNSMLTVHYHLPDGRTVMESIPSTSDRIHVLEVDLQPAPAGEKLVTPYGVKYGAHPSFFFFNKDGNMVMNESSVMQGAFEGRNPKAPNQQLYPRQIRPDEMAKLTRAPPEAMTALESP